MKLLLILVGSLLNLGNTLAFGAERAAKLCSVELLHESLVVASRPIGQELARALALDLVLDGAHRGESVSSIIDRVNTYPSLVRFWKNRDIILYHLQNQQLVSLADFETKSFRDAGQSQQNILALRKALPMALLEALQTLVQQDSRSNLKSLYESHLEPEFLTRLVLLSIQRLDFQVTSEVFNPLEARLAKLSNADRAQLLPKIQEYRYLIAAARDAGDTVRAKAKSQELLDFLRR